MQTAVAKFKGQADGNAIQTVAKIFRLMNLDREVFGLPFVGQKSDLTL